jgi:signal transduction histidine kinase
MAVKKVTRRWLLNSFAVIVLIILTFEAVAGLAVYRYYYEFARQSLASSANIVSSNLMLYARNHNLPDFLALTRDYVAGFHDKSSMELMTIDADDNIVLTSSGFHPEDISLPDYFLALQTGERTAYWVGELEPGGRVMALTLVNPLAGLDSEYQNAIAAIRLVTSLEHIDRQIFTMITGLVLLGLGVLVLILFSSSYFISSIVNPVGQIGETARRIAQGDFNARLVRKNDDEIGELCDIINHMAQELDAAERMKNDFISSVSHELRTPLTAIQGWAETIKGDEGRDAKTLERGMGIIIGETTRLSDMVEDLLDFSRMQGGRLKLVRAPVDAVAELSEAVLMYTQRAEREGIALLFEDDGVPVPVNGDKNRLRQVFINIIDNAIKYSDRGGSVTVTTAHDSQTFIVKVADTGIGIEPDGLERVKLKFYKADSTRRGSGIGLAVADEIITQHGGTLEVDSVQGEGTIVTIVLPIDDSGQLTVDS